MVGSYHWALAPYNNDKYPEVQTAIVNAVKWLQGQMTIEAGFAENSQYNENRCSTAQVLTALSVAGIDAVDPANGFTVGKKNMITNLWSYRCEDGGFYWDPSQETKANEMGTYQVTYALESYRRFAAKENSLYDLTDVATNGKEETPVDAGTITVAVERFAIGQ